jgi:hypothetical protein
LKELHGLPSQPNVARDPAPATREASPSASARIRGAMDNLHAKHELAQRALPDLDAVEQALFSQSLALSKAMAAVREAKVEARNLAHAQRAYAWLERISA